MAYNYFTKQLLAKSNEIDLTNVFADKQQIAKDKLNTNYSLPQIVDWIRDNTNNFKESKDYFKDIDLAVKRLIYKYYESTNTPNPFGELEDVISIGGAQPRTPIEIGTGKAVTEPKTVVDEKTQEILSAIEFLKDEADAGDENAKDALEFLSSIV